MIAILSPAKTIRLFNSDIQTTKPQFLSKTEILLNQLKQFSPWQLESLMKINPKLALRAFQSFSDFDVSNQGVPAVFAYDGLVYKYLNSDDFSDDDLKFADSSLRILSAFYGVLRPLDGILPYRLEMQTSLKIDNKNLYEFWEDDIYKSVISDSQVIINLASKEYSRCIKNYLKPCDKVIDIDFLANKKRKLKTIVAWAKMARGEMARYIIKNRVTNPHKLKNFSGDYEFIPKFSSDDKYTFIYNGS